MSDFQNLIEKLTTLISDYQKDPSQEKAVRDFFYSNVHQLMPNEVIIPTTWHINDIRDRFSDRITDKKLAEVLEYLDEFLNDSAIVSGFEMIDLNIEQASEDCGVYRYLLQKSDDDHDDDEDEDDE